MAHGSNPYDKEPEGVPRAGVDVLSEFYPPTGVTKKRNGQPLDKPQLFRGIVGMRLADGSVRYRCADDDCPLMYASAGIAKQHRGFKHPSVDAQRGRELKAALSGMDERKRAEAAPEPEAVTDTPAATEPEAASSALLFEVPLSGTIVESRPRRKGRPPARDRTPEDTLDFMGAEIAESAKNAVDYIIASRDANRKAYLEAADELARMTKQRDHLLDVLGRIQAMTTGAQALREEIGAVDDDKQA